MERDSGFNWLWMKYILQILLKHMSLRETISRPLHVGRSLCRWGALKLKFRQLHSLSTLGWTSRMTFIQENSVYLCYCNHSTKRSNSHCAHPFVHKSNASRKHWLLHKFLSDFISVSPFLWLQELQTTRSHPLR